MSWWVYILRCGDGTLYTGTAADVERRLAAHRRGRGAKYTRGRGPLAVVYREACPDQGAALRREAAIKKYRRAEKEALISDYAERRSRMKKAAFIGTGNMGAPLIQAACRAVGAEQVVVANRTRAKAEALAAELGCAVAQDNRAAAAQAEYIVLCVKPQMMEELLAPLRFTLAERPSRFVLCSMAAGLSIARIQEMAGSDCPVIRIMPNTPASVGAGMIQYCTSNVTAEEEAEFLKLMAPAGRLDAVPESLIDAASCVSGCGPAWVYQFIEALADGGVACGLPRAKAQEYAAQMVLGSAKLVLESGQHPGALKDAVCSPGGSTIQGVRVLEEKGLRGAVMDAVIASYNKTKEMGKG